MEGSVVNVDTRPNVDTDPDEIVYDPHYDNLEEDDNEDIYAVVELGADGKPRYLLSKIHAFLYTASDDVRRADNGQYELSRKAKERVSSEGPIKAWATPPTSAPSSNSTSSGGLRRKIVSAIQAAQHYRKAVMRNGFRQMRDDESSMASKTASGSSK